ncbi:MAG TPA: hypothetical protein P5526_21120 [Anaerolineae bacterium]|nr:hypothetical protein [Anaerolineae bacterium]
MTDRPLTTRPPDPYEAKIKEKYIESFVHQSELMDKLAQQLIMLELAIPGLYATVLKLVSGDKATVPVSSALYLTFGLWIGALGVTVMALIPHEWTVDPHILQKDPNSTGGELGIKDFFVESARYKRLRLIIATILFFSGIAVAALTGA